MKKSGFKEGEDWFEPNQSLIYLHTFPLFACFNSVAKIKLLFGEKMFGVGVVGCKGLPPSKLLL
jgi:hypothetical protein